MSNYRFVIVWGFVLAGTIGIMAWYSAAIWDECRATHSFMYCLHTVYK